MPNYPVISTRFLGQKYRDMRRRHAISPGFSGHYQDLGIASRKKHDSACKLVLSVDSRTRSRGRTVKPGFGGMAVLVRVVAPATPQPCLVTRLYPRLAREEKKKKKPHTQLSQTQSVM